MGITIIATIFVFSIIVFVHELGHFITAKLTGMQVNEFAIGFGPRLCSYRYGETTYSIRIIPLGGFNRIAGMDDSEKLNERSFLNKPVLSRLVVLAAGGFMNVVLAIALLWGVTFISGTSTVSTEPIVGAVVADVEAAKDKLQPGDRIISIGDVAIEKWSDISPAIAKYSKSIVPIVLDRNGETVVEQVVPSEEPQSHRVVLGIRPVITTVEHGFVESGIMAFEQTGYLCKAMLGALFEMVIGKQEAELAGPIGVAQLAGQVASVGFDNLLRFTALLSLNLGVLNLLPIPLLDGGHIVLAILEGVMRRRLPKRTLEVIQTSGMVILGGLFLFAMFQDISRL